MSQRTLSNPTLEVNDDTIAIVPNSLSFKYGIGKKTVKGQSSGGNAIEMVISEDAETKKSMVKFKLFNTTKNFQLTKDWLSLFSNTVAISERDFSVSLRDMVLTEEPEFTIGAEGEVELEWEGAPSL